MLYRDNRLCGFDAAVLVEVIEQIGPERFYQFEQVLFGYTRPKTIIITTLNVEYNIIFGIPDGKFQHRDHRFEWTRVEWKHWAKQMAQSYGYTVSFSEIGPSDEEVGSPTQMAVLTQIEQEGE